MLSASPARQYVPREQRSEAAGLLIYPKQVARASLVAQRLKCLPAMRETWVQSLGWEDSPGEGNGSPLQYSCLENSMYGGAWSAI